jgi:hypothetical protein
MRRMPRGHALGLASVLVVAACSNTHSLNFDGSTGGTGGSGGSGGIDGGAADRGGAGGVLAEPIIPTDTGYVDGTNAAGVIGPWYSFADSYDDDGVAGQGPCDKAGHADCSILTTPIPGQPFPPSDLDTGKMCASGIAAQVVVNAATGAEDYANITGAGIALDLNRQPTATRMPYDVTDTSAHPAIIGVSFDIDAPPPNAVRVEFPTSAMPGADAGLGTDNEPAWWGGATANTSPVKMGTNTFTWAEVGGPMALTNPPAFDDTKILSIRFHVVSNASAAIDFSFCVSNLRFNTQ